MDKKKIFTIIGVLFVGFWLFTDPQGLTNTISAIAGGIWGVTTDVFGGVIGTIKGSTN